MSLTFQGKPCKLGHTERYVNDGKCVACVRARLRRYYEANPEKFAGQRTKWRAENPERDKFLQRRWRKANPYSRTVSEARRRAAKLAAQCDCCPPELFRFAYAVAQSGGYEVDHRLPLAMGGKHCVSNLQLLTPEMHLAKTRTDLKAIAAFRRDWLSAEASPEWEAPVFSPEQRAEFNRFFDPILEQLEERN